MKSHTDLEQSQKLAEILSVESADAWWAERYEGKVTRDGQYIVNEEPLCYISFIKPSEINYSQDTVKDIPCWSLAALLEILPEETTDDNGYKIYIDIRKYDSKYQIAYYTDLNWSDKITTDEYESLVDACVEMIFRLHEQKIL